jgi:hypothetical protein
MIGVDYAERPRAKYCVNSQKTQGDFQKMIRMTLVNKIVAIIVEIERVS